MAISSLASNARVWRDDGRDNTDHAPHQILQKFQVSPTLQIDAVKTIGINMEVAVSQHISIACCVGQPGEHSS